LYERDTYDRFPFGFNEFKKSVRPFDHEL